MTRIGDVFKLSVEQYGDLVLANAQRKPQATLERAMGIISRRERDIGPALGDALAILVKAHGRVMFERNSRRAA